MSSRPSALPLLEKILEHKVADRWNRDDDNQEEYDDQFGTHLQALPWDD